MWIFPENSKSPPYHEMAWRTNANIDPGKNIWICPENKRRSNGHNLFHYTVNRHVNGSGSGNQSILSSIPAADRVVWMFDNGGRAAAAGPNNAHKDVHNNEANFLYLDGHVARFNNDDYWDFSTDRGRTNNRELIWFPLRGSYQAFRHSGTKKEFGFAPPVWERQSATTPSPA